MIPEKSDFRANIRFFPEKCRTAFQTVRESVSQVLEGTDAGMEVKKDH